MMMNNLKLYFKDISYETLFIIFVLGGYVLVSGLAIPFGVENSRIFAIPYRLLVFGISCFFIRKSLKVENFWSFPVIATIVFWLFYFIKVWYSINHDLYNLDIKESLKEIYVRIPVIVLFPSLALISLDYKKADLHQVALGLFTVLSVMLLLNLLYGVFHIHNGKLGHIFSIYYISYGHLGTSLALISFFLLEFTYHTKKEKLVFLMGLLLGLFVIVEGYARSPFLALMVSTSYLVFMTRRKHYYIALPIIFFLVIAYIYVSVKFNFNHLLFVERTYRWIFLGDNSLRTPLFERALRVFKTHPFVGGRVLYEGGMYPHNIFLELLMATGLFGFIVYFSKFAPLMSSWKIFFKRKGGGEILIFTLFIQYFTLVCTSYSLYSTPEFLHLSAMVIGLCLIYRNEKNKSYDGGRNPSRDY